jgi:very-short-patch-repair endonuclease
MDVRLVELAEKQEDLVAGWQLLGAGWSRRQVDDRAFRHGWRVIHLGVYALTRAPLTRRQRWMAATLSAPDTYLNAASTAAYLGFRPWEGAYETVVRPGSGGPRRMGALLVARSKTLTAQIMRHEGIPTVTAERALIDLAPHLGTRQLGKGFREACRLRCTTANDLARHLHGQRGTALLVALCDRYATIPYHRCRSDAESRALEILHDANVEPPRVNFRIRGEEADLSWPRHKLIIEIDGDQFHQFPDEDARKEAIWKSAGYRVRRIPSDDVYFRPERLLNKANVHSIPT